MRHTAGMISRDLAQRLAELIDWLPANGDQFYIPRPEIEDAVFTVSEMVVEHVRNGLESTFRFNGTTEWALDSIESSAAVWLPREDQLRERLADTFLSLDRQGDQYVVTTMGDHGAATHTEPQADASDAYAVALLDRMASLAQVAGQAQDWSSAAR